MNVTTSGEKVSNKQPMGCEAQLAAQLWQHNYISIF